MLVDDRKVAGILVERVERAGAGAAVVGIGVNVSSTAAELPVPSATSLLLAGATSTDRPALLLSVLGCFADRYDAWCSIAGRADAGLRRAYVEACSTIGRAVRVDLPAGDPLQGRAVGVDDHGRLLVDDGTRVHVLGVGDVVHVRPGPARG